MMIKLTQAGAKAPIWINTGQIISIRPGLRPIYDELSRQDGEQAVTVIELGNGGETGLWEVEELPEQVVQAVHNAEARAARGLI